MRCTNDGDQQLTIIDLVDHRVVANAYPPRRLPIDELPRPERMGIIGKVFDGIQHTVTGRTGKLPHLPRSCCRELDFIGHDGNSARSSAREILVPSSSSLDLRYAAMS